MSYDIKLINLETKETILLDREHHLTGGTYQLGGTRELWLNVTYNYAPHFHRVFGEKGIRSLYGFTAQESLPLLEDAISQLKDDVSKDYWESTEGNARKALENLRYLALLAPSDAIWDGD